MAITNKQWTPYCYEVEQDSFVSLSRSATVCYVPIWAYEPIESWAAHRPTGTRGLSFRNQSPELGLRLKMCVMIRPYPGTGKALAPHTLALDSCEDAGKAYCHRAGFGNISAAWGGGSGVF